MTSSLKQLNVCFIGHVDSGKSTAVGNLSYLLGAVDKRAMEKLEKEAALQNKASFKYAYLTDRTAAEKERGITITTTLINIKTGKFNLNILDCPGHQDFIKNMVTGAAQADVCVVIVPASGFEACVGEGGMLKAHITISAILGCKKVIVCVNKMDEIPENRRAEKYAEVAKEMNRLVCLNHSDKDPIIIPISAFQGTNLVKNGDKYEWFKGWVGKQKNAPIFTLEEALDYQEEPPRMTNKPLRMPIVAIHKISGIGMVYTGRVDTGSITPGMQVSIQPAGVHTEVKSLEIHKEQKSKVEAGDNCGVAFKSASKGDMSHIKAGNVISEINNQAVEMFNGCIARMIVVDKPKGICCGYIPMMDLGTVHVPVKFHSFLSKRTVQKHAVEKPERIEQNESFQCVVIPQKPLVMEKLADFPSLARFAIRDSNRIVCIGNIEKLLTNEELANDYGIHFEKKVEAKKAKGKK